MKQEYAEVEDPNLIQVLGDGFIRLVSYMQPAKRLIPGLTEWSGDLEIVRNARVSHNADWRTGGDAGKDEKVLRFMRNHNHTSPFEAMVFTFEVKAPIFVVRQWHRHRTWSYNELSGRYAELDEGFYVPHARHIGTQSGTNKQKRDINPDIVPSDFAVITKQFIERFSEQSFEGYRDMLGGHTPREVARMILPLNTYTRFFATVDLHNLFHFISLRDHGGAQWEIQQYAKALLQLIEPICPLAVKHFEEFRKTEEEEEDEREQLLNEIWQIVTDNKRSGGPRLADIAALLRRKGSKG